MSELKKGDRVQYLEDGENGDVYIVYAIYDEQHVSLGLKDYPDTEQDYLTPIRDIKKIP